VRGHYRHVVSYLKDFLFTPAQTKTPVSALSGGEKNRLMLAIALAQPSNFLVLDEPTNDLDMDTLDLLQEALDEYEGTILIVSHDRDFMDKVATSLLYMKGDGNITEYVDTYSSLLEKIKLKDQSSILLSKPKEKKKESISLNTKQKKLSFNEVYLLKTLPDKLAELEEKIRVAELKMADPDFYQEDPKEFDKTAADLEKLKSELETAETKWLELQIKQEELGAMK